MFHYFTIKFHFSFFAFFCFFLLFFCFKFFASIRFSNFCFEAKQSEAKFKSIFTFFSLFSLFFCFFRFLLFSLFSLNNFRFASIFSLNFRLFYLHFRFPRWDRLYPMSLCMSWINDLAIVLKNLYFRNIKLVWLSLYCEEARYSDKYIKIHAARKKLI